MPLQPQNQESGPPPKGRPYPFFCDVSAIAVAREAYGFYLKTGLHPDADPRRWVAPDDLARVIAFLASDDARAIHGAAIPVTGLS